MVDNRSKPGREDKDAVDASLLVANMLVEAVTRVIVETAPNPIIAACDVSLMLLASSLASIVVQGKADGRETDAAKTMQVLMAGFSSKINGYLQPLGTRVDFRAVFTESPK